MDSADGSSGACAGESSGVGNMTFVLVVSSCLGCGVGTLALKWFAAVLLLPILDVLALG